MVSRQRAVRLHIYDLGGNSFLSALGLGLHHSGVEVGGREYSYNDSGVFSAPPFSCSVGADAPCVLRETIDMGFHEGTLNDFTGTLNSLRSDFGPGTYALTSRNCNRFAEALCRALVGRGLPSYVNRAAGYGRWLGLGAKAGQVAGGDGGPAPPPAPPPSTEKKVLTAHQRALLEKIKGGG